MFAAMSASEVGVARDLLQNRIQFRGRRCDPLQVFLVEHKPRLSIYSVSFKHAHHTHNNTAKTTTPKATKASMNQSKVSSTVHAPTRGRPSIAIISFAARFYLTRGQCTTSRRALD